VDGVGTSALLASPFGVAVDPSSATLLVADFGSHRIRAVFLPNATVRTLAGGGAGGALSGAAVEGRMPSGPFVTSINGLGVSVNDWPTSDESVSAMTFHSLADVDPLVRLQRAVSAARSHSLRLPAARCCGCSTRACAAACVRAWRLHRVHRPPAYLGCSTFAC
jgi:hypothetical protein